jgi:hypothetical protein
MGKNVKLGHLLGKIYSSSWHCPFVENRCDAFCIYLGFVDLCRVDGDGVGGSYGGSSVSPAIIVSACLNLIQKMEKRDKHGSLKCGAAPTFSNAAWLVPLLVKKVSKTKSLFITLLIQKVL